MCLGGKKRKVRGRTRRLGMGLGVWDLDLREADSGEDWELGKRTENTGAQGSKTGMCGHKRSKTCRGAGEEMPMPQG